MGNNQKNTITTLNENSEINKSRALVFAQTTPSNLPITAQRLFLAVLANIDENTSDEDNVFIIRGQDIAALTGLPANVVGKQLEEMSIDADFLRKYTIVIREEDGNDLRTSLLSSTKYLKGQRAIRVAVDKFLMPYLKMTKERISISYKAAAPMKFKSEYSLRLFEVMIYYAKEGYHYFTLEEIRNVFNIPDGKIPLTSTLNQKVIAPSLRDINTYTDFEIEVKHEKKGRTIIGYHITIKNKNASSVELVSPSEEHEDDEFINKIISHPYNVNKYVLATLINKYGINSIKNNFNYTLKKKPKNFGAYLNWAISNQVFEKEQEMIQIESVNKALKDDLIPLPELTSKQKNDFVIPEPSMELDLSNKNYEESIKESNPQLYEVIMRINSKIKKQS